MGLDMYLNKKTYLWKDEEKESINGLPDGIKSSRISYIVEEVGYWRKANQVHKWFVDNVQSGEDNCEEYYVDEEKVKSLLNLVNFVIENPELAQEKLPRESGFFFGSESYDDWYFEQLQQTKKICEDILSEELGMASLYYHSSW